MNELWVLGTGLGRLETQRKMIIDASKIECEIMVAKIELTSNSIPYSHFTEHLVDAAKKPP
jgi:hypothetical protein